MKFNSVFLSKALSALAPLWPIMGGHKGTKTQRSTSGRRACTSYNKEVGARLAERNACSMSRGHALRSAKRALAFTVFVKMLCYTHRHSRYWVFKILIIKHLRFVL